MRKFTAPFPVRVKVVGNVGSIPHTYQNGRLLEVTHFDKYAKQYPWIVRPVRPSGLTSEEAERMHEDELEHAPKPKAAKKRKK